jgi:OPA family sugar phosphate sensor protein UhpC-like MFS transporter
MLMQLLGWFKTGDPQPPSQLQGPLLVAHYRRTQWRVFLALLFGYAFFYTCRLSLSVAKKPMLDAGIVTVEELGVIGSALFFAYAFGKFTNGFLADHANVRKLMSLGLGVSALLNLAFGSMPTAGLFVVLWGFNGWFQSMGSAPSGVSIFQWFEPSRRGRFYGAWAGSHNIGEAISFVITTSLVASLGWRAAFLAPGAMCVVVAIALFFLLSDRPLALGLPNPAALFGEADVKAVVKPSFRSQIKVLRMPVVWLLGGACALMYVARYAINSWGILYLEAAKGYSTVDAGFALGVYPLLGLAGAVASGAISDSLFGSERHMPTFVYGLLNIAGLALLFFGPGGAVDIIALGIFGFGIGGLIVFLAGLTAAEYCPRDAVGAVKGIIGLFSYLAASLQEVISGKLIKTTGVGVDAVYDFSVVVWFWLGAAVLSLLVAGSVPFLVGQPIAQSKPVKQAG